MMSLLFTVLILGVVFWAISQFPIPEPFRTVVYAIILIILLLVLARALGVAVPLS